MTLCKACGQKSGMHRCKGKKPRCKCQMCGKMQWGCGWYVPMREEGKS
ncbi:MAG: hypothetical protein LUD69_07465 [Oscillospiraceae bacterium]|nr:hypothetical protein [Oscillospiraceae bacterium]